MQIHSIGWALSVEVISSSAITDRNRMEKLVYWILSVGSYFWTAARQTQSTNELPPRLEKLDSLEIGPVIDWDDFTTKRRIIQITSLMERLSIYSSNLYRDLERAAKLGGVDSPYMTNSLGHSIRDQKKEIANCFIELMDTINQLYDEKVDGLDQLKQTIEG